VKTEPPPPPTFWDDSSLCSLITRLSPAERETLLRQGAALLPWTPKAGAQALAYLSPADELFFGGKAGAGKSDLLVGLGLTQHRKTLFLRRQATQLQEITSRVRDLLRAGDRWKNVGYGGLLTTGDGRTVEFTGCDTEAGKQKFKGRAHDLKAWDEVVDFPESVYLFVNGWNRTVLPHQRCRVVAASNPPTTAEGEWVIRRWRAWLDPTAGDRAAPGELRWYTTIGDKEEEFPDGAPVTHDGVEYHPRSRTFIPGEMLDLLRATGYQNTLATLPEPLRSIYLKGDFGASRQDHRWQLIPSAWVRAAFDRYRALGSDFGAVVRVGCDVAMEGTDKTVVARLRARAGGTHRNVAPLTRRSGRETTDGQSVVALLVAAGGLEVPTNIDTIGVGKSAYDVAREKGMDKVRAVVVSNSTTYRDPKVPKLTFGNLRAAVYWHLRTLLDPEGDPATRLALPPDPELEADLTAPRYELRASGVMIERKDKIKERIGRSPDAGDAVALACWERGGLAVAVSG
jgi:hypothetical protein